jgi:hypothetical protein
VWGISKYHPVKHRRTNLFTAATLKGLSLCLLFCGAERFEHVLLCDPAVCSLSLSRGHFLIFRGQPRGLTERRAHTSLVILANLTAEISPDTTPSRKLGLFLSFKLTNSERILALYPPLLVPSSSATAFSMATALWAIRSLAICR